MANAADPAVLAPSRLGILPRVILITFGVTGIAFAISLFFGILGLTAVGIVRGHLPDLRVAYRQIAVPVAIIIGTVAFGSAWIVEIRHYHQAKLLNRNDLERTR